MTYPPGAGFEQTEVVEDRSKQAGAASIAEPDPPDQLSAGDEEPQLHTRGHDASEVGRSFEIAGLWARRGLWLGPFAIALSFVLTLLLAQDEPVRTIAWCGLILAGVLAILAWGQTPWIRAFAQPVSPWPLERLDLERTLRLAGIALVPVLVWLANSQFVDHPDEVFGLAGWLWLGSMALLIASTAGWPEPGEGIPWPGWLRRPQPPGATDGVSAPDQPAPSISPSPSPATSPVQPRKAQGASRQEEVEQPPWSRWEIALFIGIVSLAVALRVWDLTSVPFAIHPDEIITGRVATQAYINPNSTSIFRTLWDNIDLPALWFLIVAQALKLGDSTLAALRLPAALFGAAAVVPFYFLLRGVWGRATAIAGASIMAFGVASVHFGRVTINNIVTPFFWAACFLFLLRALRRGRPVDWVLAGIFGGLSEHFYYGTRLLWIILIVFAVYLLVVHWQRARYLLPSFALTAVGYMAAFGPLFSWFLLNPGLYFGRASSVDTWNHLPTSLGDLVAMWNALWPPFARNLLTFGALPATDAFYSSTMLRPIEAALLVLGTALLIRRWRQPAAFLMLVSGFGVLIVGGTLVPDPGNVNHWTPAFPVIYAAVAVPVSGAAWACGRFLARRYRGYRGAAASLLGLCLALLGFYNVYYYFAQYKVDRADLDVPAAKARFQAQLGVEYQIRSVGRTWQGYDAETTAYLIKGMDGKQLWNPASELPLPYSSGKGQAFTFFADQLQYLPPIELAYPGGKLGQVNSQGGVFLYNYYIVPPGVADKYYGASLQLYDPGEETPRRVEHVPQIGSLPRGVKYPVRARWTALMYVHDNGPVALGVSGVDALILLDGQDYAASPSRPLQPGWHQITVEATLNAPSEVKLMFTGSGATPAEVPREQLWAVSPGSGLLGAVQPADPSQPSKGPLVRTDQFIGFTGLATGDAFGPQVMASMPLRARWIGQLHVTIQGTYRLEVKSNGNSILLIDGKKVVATCARTDPASATAPVGLNSGWHSIQLDYMGAEASNTLELYWTTPDAGRSLMPATALRFAPDTAPGPTQPPVPPDVVDCQAP